MLSNCHLNYAYAVGNLTSCTFFIILALSYMLMYTDVLLEFVACVAVCGVLCVDFCMTLRLL